MTPQNAEPTPSLFGSVTERLTMLPETRERSFWAALAFAAFLHSAFVFYATHTMQRVVGEKDGVDDPIAVSILTEQEYLEATGRAAQPAPPPALKQSIAPVDAPQKAEPPKPQEEAKREPPPEPEKAREQPPDQKPEPKSDNKPASEAPLSIVADNPDLLTLPDPSKSAPKTPPKPVTKPETAPAKPAMQQKQANLNLDLPRPSAADSMSGPAMSGFSRPSGITRSGENDEFGRGVLKAMKRAMPPGDGTLVTVILRTLLDPNGNVISVTLLDGDPRAPLTEQLIFGMKTATYPFPPKNATVADRTFEVRYRYR